VKHLFFIFSLLVCGLVAHAQTPAKQPVELKASRMQAQAKPAANRPDVPPQYPGGAQAMNDFFQKNLKYPEAARVKQVNANVVTTFTVQPDGQLNNITVVTPLTLECNAEALRVLKLMPAWKPATRKGEPVAVQIRLPIPFGNSTNLQVEQAKGKAKFD
jgi:protein TonB